LQSDEADMIANPKRMRGANHRSRVVFHAALLAAAFAVPALSNAAGILAPESIAPAHLELADAAPKNALLIENGSAIVVVNAPDGPTLETREALKQAREIGAKSLTIRLQNAGLIQDDQLMELIRMELADLAAEYGFVGDKYELVVCPEVCK
jgi:hypothetical protein